MVNESSMAIPAVNKEADLRRMKLMALLLLVSATVIFITSFFLPQTFAVRLLKAGAEAAMVGGLADWFAVVALFKRPLGLPIPHTAIIPRSKDRIANSLADFVREKFLNSQSLVALIQRSDPIQLIADWLKEPANARSLGRHASSLMRGWLSLIDDKHIHAFISDAARAVVGRIDFSKALGSVLDMITSGNRHQHVLDTAITYLANELRQPVVRDLIASRIANWMKDEHKWKQMVLPTERISEGIAETAVEQFVRLLSEVVDQPDHEFRKKFDAELKLFVTKLKNNEELRHKGEEIKAYVQNNPEFTAYTQGLWESLRTWLANDLATERSMLSSQIEQMGLWLGKKLTNDNDLRTSINEHMGSFAHRMAPEFAKFLTGHISDTVRKWDAEDMSHQIELSIGPDLQYIRMSGTVVGCVIGLLLFLISHAAEAIQVLTV